MRTDYLFGKDIPPYSWATILNKFNSSHDGKPLTGDYLNRQVKNNLIDEFISRVSPHPARVSSWTGAPKFHEALPNFNLNTLNNAFDEQNQRVVSAAYDEALNHENPVFYAPKVNEAPSYVQEAETPERRWVKDWLRRNTSMYY